jgi:hypothetical protein
MSGGALASLRSLLDRALASVMISHPHEVAAVVLTEVRRLRQVADLKGQSALAA